MTKLFSNEKPLELSPEQERQRMLEGLTKRGAILEREAKGTEEAYRVSFFYGEIVTTARIKLEDYSGADLVITNITTIPETQRGVGLGSRAVEILISWAHENGLNDIRAVQVGPQGENFWINNGFTKQEEPNPTNDFIYHG